MEISDQTADAIHVKIRGIMYHVPVNDAERYTLNTEVEITVEPTT